MGRFATWQLAAAVFAVAALAQAAEPDAAPIPRVIPLERLWTLGGESEAEGEIFGHIGDLAVDPAGRVYLLDWKFSELRVFSPDGEYLRTIGRPGEGPGDLNRPTRVAALPDGSLCVTQFSPARRSRFSPEGDYLGELAIPAVLEGRDLALFGVAAVGEAYVVEAITVIRSEQGQESHDSVLRFGAQDAAADTIATASSRFDYAEKRTRERDQQPFRWTLGPTGWVYLVRGFEDEIELWPPDRGPHRVIDCGYAHRLRSDEELARRRSAYGSGPQALKPELMDYDPDIQWLSAARDGRLWVMSSSGRDAGGADSLGVFDIYDQEGRLAERMELKGAGRLPEDRFYLSGDRFFVVSQRAAVLGGGQVDGDTDDDTVPSGVVCYRLPAAAFR